MSTVVVTVCHCVRWITASGRRVFGLWRWLWATSQTSWVFHWRELFPCSKSLNIQLLSVTTESLVLCFPFSFIMADICSQKYMTICNVHFPAPTSPGCYYKGSHVFVDRIFPNEECIGHFTPWFYSSLRTLWAEEWKCVPYCLPIYLLSKKEKK